MVVRLIDWITAHLFGYRRVRSREVLRGRFPMVDITVEPSHAFYVRCGSSWLKTHNCIIDDPYSEQDAVVGSGSTFAKTYDWYLSGPRQRLMPNGRIVVVHTRWSADDLIARVLQDGIENPGADQYEYLELPAILPSGDSFWPEMWPVDQLLRVKATMEARGKKFLWDAQYMQRPTGAGQTFVTREMFRTWTKDKPPPCDYIILSLDAAVEATKRSDFNVFLTCGIFTDDEIVDEMGDPIPQVIVLDMVRKRAEFPELKELSRQCIREYNPDVFLIERKANGAPLLQELRQSGIGAQAFDPGTQDKAVRFGTVVDMIQSGLVWVPEGYSWCEQFLDEICGFPNMPNDDIVDAAVQILIYLRRGGYVGLPSDDPGESDPHWFRKQHRAGYGARPA